MVLDKYSANFLFTLWKRVRKYGACCTGLTTNVDFGRGLIKCGSAIVPFMDTFPKHTQLYKRMTTKPSDLAA